jgi:hypothetical protein
MNGGREHDSRQSARVLPRSAVRRMALISFCALCVSIVATPTQSQAQAPRGRASLSGTLYDVKRGVIVRAPVTLLNLRTKEALATTSSDEGRFAFDGLAAGDYNLKIEANGFERHERKDIRLEASDDQNFCVTLEVRAFIDTVIPVKRSTLGMRSRLKCPPTRSSRKKPTPAPPE